MDKDGEMSEPSDDLRHAKALLFDLDGTLLDSFPVHFAAYQATFARFGIHLTEEHFLATYSPNWLQTYETLGLPRQLWDQADEYWLETARQLQPVPFPGVAEALRALQEAFLLGIVTSGSKERVLRDLKGSAIGGFFQALVTGDDVRQPKPSPEGMHLALAALGVGVDEAVYIGDTLLDLETAQAAGVRFLGIPSQFASLKPDTPCMQVGRFADLPRAFGLE
jgi:HAD superfamily hydrolase (TIGR01549 family)